MTRTSIALRTAILFLGGSLLWLTVFRDDLAFRLPRLGDWQERLHTYPGLALVVVMAPLLYWFLRRAERAREAAERARAEDALRAEVTLRESQLAGRLGTWSIDLASHAFTGSPALIELLGLTPADWNGRLDLMARFIRPSDYTELLRQCEVARDTAEPLFLTVQFRRPRAAPLILQFSSRVVFDDFGVPRALAGSTVDITELTLAHEQLVRSQERLAQNQQRMRQAFEAAPLGVIITLADGRMTWVNTAARTLLGWERDDTYGKLLRSFMPEDSWPVFEHSVSQVLAGETNRAVVQVRCRHKEGRMVWVRANISVTRTLEGQPRYFIHMLEDITAELAHEAERHEAYSVRQLSSAVFEYSGAALAITDAKGRYIEANRAFEQMTGFANIDLKGLSLDSLIAPNPHNTETVGRMLRHLQREDNWTGEYLGRRRSGELYRMLATVTAVRNEESELTNHVVALLDLTEQRQLNERISHLLRTDQLTGLPNRTALEERLKAQTEAARPSGDSVGLILLGYDRFAAVNELLGSAEADRVLREAAGRLTDALDDTHFVARFGGSRFAVLAPVGTGREALIELAKRCMGVLESHRGLKSGIEVPLTVSAGLSTATPAQGERGSLINQAESALLLQGPWERSTLRFFSPEVAANVSRRLAVETGLLHADIEKEFCVLLQPKWDIASKRMTGAEALLRWTSPELGDVSPMEFVPIAEQHPIILDLGRFVVAQVVAQLREQTKRFPHLRISVNLSARQMEDPALLEFIIDTVQQAEVPPRCLEFELTETYLVQNQREAQHFLNALRKYGFTVALDDFGAGYSSLSYLAQLPVDSVKLDRSFVEQLPANETACVVAASVLEMAKRLSMVTVAEGVETEGQRSFLERAGCAQAQGWLVSPAIRPEEFFFNLAETRQVLPHQALH